MLEFLESAAAAGRQLQNLPEDGDAAARLRLVAALPIEERLLKQARSLVAPGSFGWDQLGAGSAQPADLSRALAAAMEVAPPPQALRAAVLYTSLLRTPGCPVSGACRTLLSHTADQPPLWRTTSSRSLHWRHQSKTHHLASTFQTRPAGAGHV